MHDDDRLEEIQNDFKRRELLNHALGPSISLLLHVALFLVLFFVVKAQFEESDDQLQVEIVQEVTEEIIETPEDIDEITETELQSADSAEDDAPQEESPDNINTDISEQTLDVPDSELLSFTFDSSTPFKTRSFQGKAVQVAKGGGDRRALSSVLTALKWLKANQNPDGSWGNRKSALTALATLLYLAHGETPSSKHFGKTVEKAFRFLVKSINEGGDSYRRNYGLAMMVYAVSEGYSLTSIQPLKEAMDKGVAQLLSKKRPDGMYGYDQPIDITFSVTGWVYQAYKAAYLAGCENELLAKEVKKIPGYVIANSYSIDDRRNSKDSFFYRPGSKGANGSSDKYISSSGMRATGALVLQLFGKKEEAQAAARVIASKDIRSLRWDNGSAHPIYSWYYATQVMYNNKSRDTSAWNRWNRTFQTLLYKNQHKDGYWQSFGSEKSHAGLPKEIDNKIYSTALAGLMLTVYYRYLPTTTLEKPRKTQTASADTAEIELDFL